LLPMHVLDFDAVADAMWHRARSGFAILDGAPDSAYVRRCSRRVGSTGLVFTRDQAETASGRFRSPALQRCWHLSIACSDGIERDAWLRAFFADHVEALWAETAGTASGRAFDVWHWRLFCDRDWLPVSLDDEPVELRAAGLIAAAELTSSLVSARA